MTDPSALDAVDLRSDTVTTPDAGMRSAIAAADVGDDALDGDPTTRRLEARVADLLGKEAGLFFPSGIMANQAAIAVLAPPGSEVVCEVGAHIMNYEAGAASVLSGVQLRTVPGVNGTIPTETLRAAIRPDSPYLPNTSAVSIENTHLNSGGKVLSVASVREVAQIASEFGLPVHLDGARLWHAAVKLGEPARAWADHADTVSVALSKGLGCPVGSILAGSFRVISEARSVRRRFGGGMRQTGVLAAAGLYALDHNVDRLSEDHAHASELAKALNGLDGFEAAEPETNIVLASALGGDPAIRSLLRFLEAHRILMLPFGSGRLRAVTHMGVTGEGIARIVDCLRQYAPSGPAGGNLA